ncbi:hypothetical protein [Nocardia gamkensis]|uniref:hypothetical protein n=1 Tax=Nocardia gamkensis TaxID=352869 RepID=UPI0037C64967
MPPHIAQILLGHKDISTTMDYKAVYPQEAINGYRAFIARRRNHLRPSEEYRTATITGTDAFTYIAGPGVRPCRPRGRAWSSDDRPRPAPGTGK